MKKNRKVINKDKDLVVLTSAKTSKEELPSVSSVGSIQNNESYLSIPKMYAQEPSSILSPKGNFPIADINRSVETLTISDTVGEMCLKSAEILIAGGKKNKDAVVMNGGLRIPRENGQFFIARFAPTSHTKTDTSLKRLVAAAGMYLANLCVNTNFQMQLSNITNSLCVGQGIESLREIDTQMYFLYNVGLEYELESNALEGKVLALMAWRCKHSSIIYKSSNREIYEDFRSAVVIFEKKYGKDPQKWQMAANSSRQYCAVLKNLTPTIGGGRSFRAAQISEQFQKYIMPNIL